MQARYLNWISKIANKSDDFFSAELFFF